MGALNYSEELPKIGYLTQSMRENEYISFVDSWYDLMIDYTNSSTGEGWCFFVVVFLCFFWVCVCVLCCCFVSKKKRVSFFLIRFCGVYPIKYFNRIRIKMIEDHNLQARGYPFNNGTVCNFYDGIHKEILL